MPRTFTSTQKLPAAVYLRYRDGVYSVDADKTFDEETTLSLLVCNFTNRKLISQGRSMEKLLTLPPDRYDLYRKENSHNLPKAEKAKMETYHYSEAGNLLMRSQIDCYDSRLPGCGVFDLKTRAVVAVRMDLLNARQYGSGYQIKTSYGMFESFEREYYDMIRAAYLKYSLQVRIGRMDGIFVAYHNTERIFGFQYVSLDEMDTAIHGSCVNKRAKKEFMLSLNLLNIIFEKLTNAFPQETISVHIETREGVVPKMLVFAVPVSENDIEDAQNNQGLRILKQLKSNDDPIVKAENVKSVNNDDILLDDDTEEFDDQDEAGTGDRKGIVAFEVRVFHRLNHTPVTDLDSMLETDIWEIDYSFQDIANPHLALERLRRRRQNGLTRAFGRDEPSLPSFIRHLRNLSTKGRKWMETQTEDDLKRNAAQTVYKPLP